MKPRMIFAILCFALSVNAGFFEMTALADVDVNIHVGGPPAVVVTSPPTMLFLGEPGVFVAVGVPYDLFFLTGRYYYFHGNQWYWAAGYGGPWVVIQMHQLPHGLQKFKIKQLVDFRDREHKAYKSKGAGYKGKQFIAVKGPGPKSAGPAKGPAMKEGKGKGKGR